MSRAVLEEKTAPDFLFKENLSALDSDIGEIIHFEEERQLRKLIMIASESICPPAVQEALASNFSNIYAEGYPQWRMEMEDEAALLDYPRHLAYYRRYGDKRYYKGCDYANFIEAVARRRLAEIFATPDYPADKIFSNVQPLSGAAANNSVYEAFLSPGDKVMGMNLAHGGHLSHGGAANRSGKRYSVCSYGVNPKTEHLDYDEIRALARKFRPKMIIAGTSAYPWTIDWTKFREIADEVGAYLLADIAHPAGLVVTGLYPSPVGIADAVSFTTHKTLCGPRGAAIMATNPEIAKKINTAVFPGEQGGPHLNQIAGKAVCFKIAATEKFKKMQQRTLENAQALAESLKKRDFKLAYGGTDTHLLLIDLKAVKTATSVSLRGEIASRLLDLAGITCNKNTIAGDTSAAHPSAIRLGTTWLTQRGMGPAEMEEIADIIHGVLLRTKTFSYFDMRSEVFRGKVDMEVLDEARERVEKLAACFGAPRRQAEESRRTAALEVTGERAALFLQGVLSVNVAALAPGDSRPCFLLGADGKVLGSVLLKRSSSAGEPPRYFLRITSRDAVKAVRWLKYLSDGYVVFDEGDLLAKVDGPAVVQLVEVETPGLPDTEGEVTPPLQGTPVELYKNGFASWFDLSKLFFVGQNIIVKDIRPESKKKEFKWEPEELPLRRTVLYEEHKKLTNRIIPFAGWEMPVWYTSIGEEHRAVRHAAGLFDVSHMGVLEIVGEHAARFLDSVTANYVPRLIPGQSHYSYLLDPDGGVIDDIMVYCRAQDRFMVVVNAANAEKDLAWLLAVNSGEVLIDREHPWKEPEGKTVIRDLKDPSCGAEMRVDIALQGPASLPTILALADKPAVKRAIRRMLRTEFIETELAGIPVLLSRTGYTGEEIAFELYLHPDHAPRLWKLILEKGKPFGVIPTGLGARDSTRTEAGLPLYGHELAGKHGINPIEAGYAGFVKLHKPYFIGRKPLIESLEKRKIKVARFKMLSRGIRVVKSGDPVVNRRGETIGEVTSCAAVDGIQIGLCFIRGEYAGEGERIAVFILSREGTAPEEKRKDSLKPGDRVLLAEPAVILNRYPKPGSFARTAEVKGEEE